jgi:hypothetical protein
MNNWPIDRISWFYRDNLINPGQTGEADQNMWILYSNAAFNQQIQNGLKGNVRSMIKE